MKKLILFCVSFFTLVNLSFTAHSQTYNVCNGDQIILDLPSYAGSLQWQISSDSVSWSDISGATYAPYLIVAVTNQYYRSKVVNGTCNPVYSGTKKIIITPSPEITTQPDDQTICAGIATNFSVTATGAGLIYQWQVSTDGGTIFNNISSVGSNPSYFNYTTPMLSLTGTVIGNNNFRYRCLVNGTCTPSDTSNVVTLTVNTVPTGVTATAAPNPLCAGGTLTLTGGASGATTWNWTGPNDFSSTLQSPTITDITAAGTGVYTLTVSNSCGSAMAASTSSVTVLYIGLSYQGGTIAYLLQNGDTGYDLNVPHGIIAAQSDMVADLEWGCYGTLITGADATSIGTGSQNTTDIVSECSTATTAAKLCYNLVVDGKNDWYLPSKDELNMLFISKVLIGGFDNEYYWSSSEYSILHAWLQNFTTGATLTNVKYSLHFVRAVRWF